MLWELEWQPTTSPWFRASHHIQRGQCLARARSLGERKFVSLGMGLIGGLHWWARFLGYSRTIGSWCSQHLDASWAPSPQPCSGLSWLWGTRIGPPSQTTRRSAHVHPALADQCPEGRKCWAPRTR